MPANAHELKHEQINNDLDEIYTLLKKQDERQRRHEARFELFAEATTGRLEGIDGRLEGIDGRLEGIDGRLEGLSVQMNQVQQGLAIVVDLVQRPSAAD